jgi:putative membrane protein
LAGETPKPDLAVDRTRLAHERTLMAWVRTAVSLISFGFTIYKFFDYVRQKGERQEEPVFGPREFAGAMIGIGLTVLVLATIQHIREVRAMRSLYGAQVSYSLAAIVAVLVGALGVMSILAVIFRQ